MKSYLKILLILGLIAFAACEETPDLGNTYFPTAEGYRWTYERCSYGMTTSESYDTFTIQVLTVDHSKGVWISCQLAGGSFEDVGNEVLIQDNRVIVFEGFDTIPLIPLESTSYEAGVTYYGDTLHLYRSTGEYEQDTYRYVNRVMGIGVISQGYEENEGFYVEKGYSDRILSFQKGDTIWRFP